MTREEAIKELKEDIELYIPLHGTIDDVDRDLPDGRLITALEMAIKALEHPERNVVAIVPCGDAISRENTIEQIKIAQKKEYTFDYASLIDFIKVLPPVNPQPNKEDIYREREQAYMRGFEDGSRKYRTEQSEDAIRRQAAIIQLSHNKNGDDDCDVIVQKDIETIKALPPVNSQPKTGHWIYDNSLFNWRCSECNETPKTMGYVGTADFMTEHFKFCNHCGAKMIEPQESEG